MRRREVTRVVVVLAVVTAAAVATGLGLILPKAIPASPGSAGSKGCDVGRSHAFDAYSRDLGCLRGNLALAALGPAALEPGWARSVGDAARDVAVFASTLRGSRPEALAIEAVRLDLMPATSPHPSKDAVDALCGVAKATLEDACISYYCGSPEMPGASSELSELGIKLQSVCNSPPRCLPSELDRTHATCQKTWREATDRLALAIRARQDVKIGGYSPGAIAAVQRWSSAEAGFRDRLRESVFAGVYDQLPAQEIAVESSAASALLAVRQDQVKAHEKDLDTLKQVAKAEQARCSASGDAACKAEVTATALEVKQTQDRLVVDKQRIGQAEKADVGTKLELLKPEVRAPSPRLRSRAATPP